MILNDKRKLSINIENIGSELNKAYANNSLLKTSCKNLF